jgi:hypothetical protein
MRRAQQGYVLIIVLAALALMAAVALRVAERVDRLRDQAQNAEQAFAQRKDAVEAWHAALYAVLISQSSPAGWGSLRGDGRLYVLSNGAQLRFQDERGRLSVNVLDRTPWLQVLQAQGENLQSADTLIDVLADYADLDSARRLNGAETDEYRAMNLPPPRNDWLLSTAELARMPQWRERAVLRHSLGPWLTTGLVTQINPNTAPLGLLKALYPGQAEEVWIRFDLLREALPFASKADLLSRTGLLFAEDRHSFYAGLRLSLSVWPAGAKQGLQYNLALLPAGQLAPWLVTSVQPVALPPSAQSPSHVTPLPLDFVFQPRS